MYTHIDFEIQGAVAILAFNRPQKYNAIFKDMAYEILDALQQCRDNETIRAVYLTGRGKAFCAGQDLEEVTDPNGPPLQEIVSKHYNPIVKAIRSLPKPVVAAVNGVAAGAGANIALCCDVVIATQSSSFIQAFSKIGLIPDSGGTWTLPRLVGFQKASALMMLADKVSAEEAERLGMVYKVMADDVFVAESMKIAETLAAMPTLGLAYTKEALNQTYSYTFEQQLEVEDRWQTTAGTTYDYKEGVEAFLQKRQPKFLGK